ncbi:MAG: cyclopropane-fatty-acyl-phospholipid synthase family protein [Pseudomonadota bacterium]
MSLPITLAERTLVPDSLIRLGIRSICSKRLREERRIGSEERLQRLAELRQSHIALHTGEANEQHYEVATEFFERVLGPRLKYSASIFPRADATLAEAEENTLGLYEQRLALDPGHRVLDLGCGWGSFSLWLAERRPDVRLTAVSNSSTQKRYIDQQASERGLTNLEVVTADINALDLEPGTYDRVISIEMFEHVRNYAELLAKISRWMAADGRLFVHIFCHREFLYPYETRGASDWMAKYFFTGGLMPAVDTLSHFQDDLTLVDQQVYSGDHYARTSRAWLANMDASRDDVRRALTVTYGDDQVDRWVQRWRIFFMACEELFGNRNGTEWQIGHYLFEQRNP